MERMAREEGMRETRSQTKKTHAQNMGGERKGRGKKRKRGGGCGRLQSIN
jgi:hypothetical protein